MTDFTEELNPDSPSDSDLASSGDDSIRQFKRAFIERITPLVKNMDSKPWELDIPDGYITLGMLDPNSMLRSIIRAVASISGTIAAGVIAGGPQAVPGAEPGDTVLLSWATGDGRFCLNGAVTAIDTVTVSYANITAAPVTLSSSPLLITVIKPGVPGVLQTDILRVLPFTLFQPANITDPVIYTTIAIELAALTAVTIRAGIALPSGRQLLNASVKVNSTGVATVSGDLVKVSASGVITTLASFAPAAGSGDQIVIENVTYTVVAGDMFYFDMILSSLVNAPDVASLSWAKIGLV